MQRTDVEGYLNECLLMYHSVPQEITGISLAQMMFNRNMENFLPIITKLPP